MLVSPGQLVVIGISIAVGFVVFALSGFLLHVTILVLIGVGCLIAHKAWITRNDSWFRVKGFPPGIGLDDVVPDEGYLEPPLAEQKERPRPAPLPGTYQSMSDEEQKEFLRNRGYQ